MIPIQKLIQKHSLTLMVLPRLTLTYLLTQILRYLPILMQTLIQMMMLTQRLMLRRTRK
ncbi:hypothetical protein ACEE42_10605 [Streptococcus suis]